MMNLDLVRRLREITGAGILDCKKALSETEGDIEKACDLLRKKGIAAAAKKTGRAAAEGLVGIKILNQIAVAIELNSETDFVAKNQAFITLADNIMTSFVESNHDDVMNLQILSSGRNVAEEITAAVGSIGENIKLRKYQKLSINNGFLSSYIHSPVAPNLGRIAVLLSVKSSHISDEAKALAKQISMHIAAQKPIALLSEEIPVEILNREKEIFSEQAAASGKSAEIVSRMVEGRVRKFYEEVVLLEQQFVIDGKTKIKDIISEFNKKNSSDFSIVSFLRFEVGEGIEKQKSDFAEEVQSMISSS